MLETFELIEDDECIVDLAIQTARRFLKHPQITPLQVVGLGNALYALERLPLVTPGACTEFGIFYRVEAERAGNMRYIQFRISESYFGISVGGSIYDSSVGSESFSDPGWYVEIGGYRETNSEVFGVAEDIENYLSMGAVITVCDESIIEYAE